jgi:hypothetical protein
MTTANFYVLAAEPLQSDQGLKEQNRTWTEHPLATWTKRETQPEVRLWKVCAEAACSRLRALEWLTFVFFGALALGAVFYCFSELFQLVHGGALDETVRALLAR